MKLKHTLQRLSNQVERPGAGDLWEHAWRVSALALARRWAETNDATFVWAKNGRSSTRPRYDLWECHVSIGGQYVTWIGGYDFGPDGEPGDGNSAVWAEADAALRVMAGVGLGRHEIMYPDD